MRHNITMVCASLLIAACQSQQPITRNDAYRRADQIMSNLVATNALPAGYELVGESLDSTNGTRMFSFRAKGCELQIDVGPDGDADVAGMKGECPS